ncbi:uncharacterized protein LOC130277510 [Hyla sarda]|uniref:uncharacterized protein LOC130277510 n=1 Tax=Hyla sarda TaxID=327740 RepID=UPI0024C2203B|nr:uncharacterized protein LOC130277510 [Hyla sarda]
MAGGEEVAQPNNCRSCCCNLRMIIQMAFFGIWTAISVALIVVGGKYRDECIEEPYIPVYMIVAGAFSFAYWVLLPFECCFPTLRRIVSILVAMFVFAWFIAGSVWVFRIYHITNRYCHKGMYLFIFSVLIIQYIFIGLGVIASLLACLCCENSCVARICKYFEALLECCPCLECLRCFQNLSCSCLKCLECCQNLPCCRWLKCCKCLDCCKCLQCCKCLDCTKCLECCKCLQCSCLQNCNCLQCCSCLENCNCLQCLKCSDCCKCLQCCDCFKSLCCCCKSIQCSSCLNCSLCASCCSCLPCCAAKV